MSTCVVLDGSRRFEIAGSVSGVELKGLAFVGATNVSVGSLGLSNASATFNDCEWAGQSVGTANVLIYIYDGSSLCG
eukprot:4225998-Ditylum_brightwellii.AAC.1